MNALLVSLLLAQSYYTPQEAQSLFQEANVAYSKGDFAGARERYERLIEHGQGGADVLYNLGTAALAEGKLGPAVLSLERARRAGGAEVDVDGNLGVARARQLDQVAGETTEEPLSSRIAEAVPRLPVTAAFVTLWAAGWLLLVAARRVRGLRVLGILVLLLGAVPSGFLLLAHVVAEHAVLQGVVMAPVVSARELPSADAKISFEAHAGLKVQLLQNVGDFVHIRLPNGLEGWTEQKTVTAL